MVPLTGVRVWPGWLPCLFMPFTLQSIAFGDSEHTNLAWFFGIAACGFVRVGGIRERLNGGRALISRFGRADGSVLDHGS